jgi:class 3 adenylate cyclase
MNASGRERTERRLAAILAADVAGYSRLIGADEEGTLDRLRSIRAELIDPKIALHRGRIVKTTGDGLLVEFASVVDALRCASEWQRAMAERNAGISDDRIQFRIGINFGDVVVENGDIFGGGVNVAARLEALADPGGICVSARVQEDAAGRLDLVFEDMGDQALKNIARAVRVYRIRPTSSHPNPPPQAEEGATRAAASNHPPPQAGEGRVGADGSLPLALPDKPSIAVLPFQNKNVKKTLWLIVYLIWMVGDVEGFWDKSRSLCLILGVVGACCLAFAELDDIKWASLWSVAAVIIGIGIYGRVPNEIMKPPHYEPPVVSAPVTPIPPPAPWRGWLQPANEATPPNACDSFPGVKDIIVLLGDSAFSASNEFIAGKHFTPFSTPCGAMTVDRGANGIRISMPIFDQKGVQHGEIKDNGYDIPNETDIIVEHTGDLSTLIAHNTAGDEILYVRYLNEHAMRVQGIFACPQMQRPIIIDNEKIAPTPFREGCDWNTFIGMMLTR